MWHHPVNLLLHLVKKKPVAKPNPTKPIARMLAKTVLRNAWKQQHTLMSALLARAKYHLHQF